MAAPSASQQSTPDWSECDDSHLLLDNVIKRTLIRSLEQTHGNRRRAADLLGVSRSTLYRMLERYELSDRPGADTAMDAASRPMIVCEPLDATRATKCRAGIKSSRESDIDLNIFASEMLCCSTLSAPFWRIIAF